VDSSYIGVGFILLQLGDDGKRYPSRFGSITWSERESRYSQAKIELYGLFRALHSLKIYIIGVSNLAVEMDASYIKGMLNRPDIHPAAVLNRWIAAVKLFDFVLRHVPAEKMPGADGLSRRVRAEEDPEEESDAEQWLDNKLESYLAHEFLPLTKSEGLTACVFTMSSTSGETPTPTLPYSDFARSQDVRLQLIKEFLTSLSTPSDFTADQKAKLLKDAGSYFVLEGRLYRKDRQGRHQRVVPYEDRLSLLKQAHDELGHRGFFPVRRLLLDRFWWPGLAEDVKWYIKTCLICQQRSFTKLLLRPTVAPVPSLFRKVYIDTMFMPKSDGCRYLVQARCALTSYVEYRPLRRENTKTLSSFIFEDIICRWGCLSEIVTDNGEAFKAAAKALSDKFQIKHIRVSAYNSRANGAVERSHRDMRESLLKACDGDPSRWTSVAPYVFWADRVTTRRATGHSPFFMAHGVEPVLPFDISEATYLFPPPQDLLSTQDLIVLRAQQLQKRDVEIARYQDQVYRRRLRSAEEFEEKYARSIKDYNFDPGTLVLVRDAIIDKSPIGKKVLPRYNGPFIVVRRRQNGSYQLSELDGTVSRLRIAAFRVVPFHSRPHSLPPPVPLPQDSDSEGEAADFDPLFDGALTEDSQD
jgi:hypothetical protein